MEKKSTKYFLNLEKRNHIRKHIRKLNLSGVITTDPFEILEAEKSYYKNLYSSKQLTTECQESSQFFDNPNIPVGLDLRSLTMYIYTQLSISLNSNS